MDHPYVHIVLNTESNLERSLDPKRTSRETYMCLSAKPKGE